MMRFVGNGLIPALAVGSLLLGGCQKAKDAIKDALGVDDVSSAEIAEYKAKAGWDDADPRYKDRFKIYGGFVLKDKFKGDLSDEVTIPAAFVPGEAKYGESKARTLALLKVREFEMGGTTYTRFQIVSVAKYVADSKSIVVSGKDINQFLDEDQRLSKSNQADCTGGCTYLLVEGVNSALAYLKGKVEVKKDGADKNEPVEKAIVFTNGSPFVTESGSSGMYLLAMLEGEKGAVTAYKEGLGKSVTGTAESTSTQIPYVGVLEDYKDDKAALEGKAKGEEFTKAKAGADKLFEKTNGMVTDYLGMWKLVDADLLFNQPPQKKIDPPATEKVEKPATPAATTGGSEVPKQGSEPTSTAVAAAAVVAAPTDISRGLDPATDPQVDLGCSNFYYDKDGVAQNSVLYDFTEYANDKVPGWRFQGDVRITDQQYYWIFGDVGELRTNSGGKYLDQMPGYCLLSTGDSLYQSLDDAIYLPGPDGAGQVSEMWQKVALPSKASGFKSIQVRVAFFSQEFPKFIGTKYNDSFFIKFDESLDFIAAGNLNDLAIGKDPATQESALATCKEAAIPADGKCGDWVTLKPQDAIAGKADAFNGQLFQIENSTQAQSQGIEFGALPATWSDSNERAYHGMIKPKVICKNLSDDDLGKVRTLRFHVEDAGDNLFDSALAVDSVVFSKEECGDKTTTFTKEEPSRVNDL